MAKNKNIICLVGSLNQTTQMHQIAEHLTDYNVYYTQSYGDGLLFKFIAESGLVDNTITGTNSSFVQKSRDYINENNLNYDYRARSKKIEYDLALLSTDLLLPKSLRSIKNIWVQEGMIDPITTTGKIVRRLNLPGYIAGSTQLNGTSNIADIYFAMSEGYKDYFVEYGTQASKIFVTGVPNFDNIAELKHTEYPYSDYVLIATSDIRELGGNDDRDYFLDQCIKIANGRKIIVKPHPNEKLDRVESEVFTKIPDATIVTEPIIDTLIAHCNTLITQYSSCVYIGLVLDKIVYSYFPIEELEKKKPIQNHGKSAKIIADVCREYIEYDGKRKDFISHSETLKPYK